MKDEISAFWRQYSAFKLAVTNDDFEVVQQLDAVLNKTIDLIVNRPAATIEEIFLQFKFATDLLNVEAEDVSCVKKNICIIRSLIEKHVGLGLGFQDDEGVRQKPASLPFLIFDEARFDDNSTPTLLVTDQYIVGYANAAFEQTRRIAEKSSVGGHLADVVGLVHFRNGLKDKIDLAMAGEVTRFAYVEDCDGKSFVWIHDITPVYSPADMLVGALIQINKIADRRGAR